MILLSFITWFFVPSSMQMHDIHVSVCEIEVKAEKIDITLKTFLDDLQIAMGLIPGEELPEDYTSSDEMIDDYIKATFKLVIDGTKSNFEIIDISAANDAVWISMNLPKTSSHLNSIELESSFLTEVYDDQTNIVNIKANDSKESYILNRKKKLVKYEMDK